MQNNKYVFFILTILSSTVFSACSAGDSASDASESLSRAKFAGDNGKIERTDGESDSSGVDMEANNGESKLLINDKCVGCKHCVIIDPEHFSSKVSQRIPSVISQENLDSKKLQMAISRCPVDSIELES